MQDDIKTIRLVVNSADAENKLLGLRNRIEQLEKEKQKFSEINDTKGYNKAQKEIRQLQRELQAATARSTQLEQTLRGLDKATPKQLKETISVISRQLNSGSVARGSKEWEAMTRQLVAAKTALREINGEMSAQKHTGWGEKVKGFLEFANQANWFIMATDNAVAWMRKFVTQAAEMKEAEAEVVKYTGLSAKQVEGLNEELLKIDTRTPREKLNGLAADAGRLGIQGKEAVLEFVKAADQINLALGADLGEEGVKNIGKLAQLFEPDAPLGKSMLRTASLINDLAQSSSASEGYILDFTARLAGVGRQAGISQANIAGFGSVLDQSMIGQERAATALSNIITAIYRHPQEMAKKAGLDVKEFTTLLQRDANAALLQFIGALAKAGSLDSIAPMLDEMKLSGSGVTQTLTVLASQLEKVESTQKQATAAYAEGISATEEAAKSNSTMQAEMEKAKKRAAEMGIALGNELAPAMKHLTTTSSLLVRFLLTLIKLFKAYPGVFITAAVAISGYTLAVKANLIATTLWSRATIVTKSVMRLYVITIEAVKLAYFRMTGATVAAARAQRILSVVTKATPWGAIIGAVTALVAIIATFITRTKTLTAEQRAAKQAMADLIDVQAKAAESTIEEKKRIELLNAIIRDNARSIGDRKRALTDLRKIIPSYHGEITKEGKLIRDNAKAINDYITNLDKMALAEALYEKMKANAAKKVSADLAIQSWEQGIKNRDSIMKSKGHESRTVKVAYEGIHGKAYIREVEQNETRIEDEKIQRYNKSRLEAWKKERQAIDATDKAYKAYIKKQGIEKQIEAKVLGHTEAASPGNLESNGGGSGYSGSDNKKKGTKVDPEKLEQERLRKASDSIKKEAKMRADIEQMNFLRGQSSKKDHEEALFKIEADSLEKQMQLYAKGSAERVELERKMDELLTKRQEQHHAWSRQQIEVEQREEEAAAREAYLTGVIEEQEYEKRLDAIKLRAIQRRAEMARKWLGDDHQTTREAEREEAAESARQQLDRHKRYQQQLRQLREAYAAKSAAERMAEELKQLDELHKAKLLSEEEYLRLLSLIKNRYKGKGGEMEKEGREKANAALETARERVTGRRDEANITPSGDTLGVGAMGAAAARISIASRMHQELNRMEREGVIAHAEAEAAKTQLSEQHYANIRELASAAFAAVGAISQQLTQLNNADRDLELARIEQHYAQRVKLAGGNNRQTRQLEEEKNAQIAKVKTKYAQREAKMQIAQAIAQTAVNAIAAYGSVVKIPFVGPVLAIAAAAAAVAAGAVQIATIRKQAEAQAAGYYKGGFTGGNRYRKEAGVVHEGEFVANHEAVNNPQLLPVLQLIDQAQRSHRVAHLTAADISAVVTQPHQAAATSIASSTTAAIGRKSTAEAAPIVVQAESPQTTAAIERLTASLEAGITATVALSGRDGLHEQYTRYRRNLERS